MPGIICLLDDVFIASGTIKQHKETFGAVFQRILVHGVRQGLHKCVFISNSIKYLEHIISEKGLHTSPDKIEAILKAPKSENISQLQAFIGLVTYYSKFVENMATECAPLYAQRSKLALGG